MQLFEFEIFTDEGSVRYAQWALDEDHAFEILSTTQPECLNGFQPAFFEVLFERIGEFNGPMVYWLKAGEA